MNLYILQAHNAINLGLDFKYQLLCLEKGQYNMSNEKDRVLSYKLATVLDRDDLDKVSGGKGENGPLKTMRTQRPRSTQGGKDETIDLDGFD